MGSTSQVVAQDTPEQQVGDTLELLPKEKLRQAVLLTDISKIKKPCRLVMTSQRLVLVDDATEEILLQQRFEDSSSLLLAVRKRPKKPVLVLSVLLIVVGLMVLPNSKVAGMIAVVVGSLALVFTSEKRLVMQIYSNDEIPQTDFYLECEPFEGAEKFLPKLDKLIQSHQKEKDA